MPEQRPDYDRFIIEKDGKFTWYDETGDVGGVCDTRLQCYEEMDEYCRKYLG